MIILCGIYMCQPVMAMDWKQNSNSIINEDNVEVPFISNYIDVYTGDLQKIGSRKLELEASMIASNTDKIEIKAQLQKKVGSRWDNYGSPYSTIKANPSIGLTKQCSVSSGTYRVKFTFNAYVGNRVAETRYYTSSETVV